MFNRMAASTGGPQRRSFDVADVRPTPALGGLGYNMPRRSFDSLGQSYGTQGPLFGQPQYGGGGAPGQYSHSQRSSFDTAPRSSFDSAPRGSFDTAPPSEFAGRPVCARLLERCVAEGLSGL